MWLELTEKFSKLGDPVLLLLAALGVFLYLWIDDERRVLARPWAIAFATCVLLTLVGKFSLHLVRWNEAGPLRLLSPSGHVAIGTGFYGCCAIMLASGRGRGVRVAAWIGMAVLLGLLAVSRLVLALHSVPEIAIAFAIGGLSLALFARHLQGTRPIPVQAGHVVSLFFLIFAAYFTRNVHGEALLIHVVRALNP